MIWNILINYKEDLKVYSILKISFRDPIIILIRNITKLIYNLGGYYTFNFNIIYYYRNYLKKFNDKRETGDKMKES